MLCCLYVNLFICNFIHILLLLNNLIQSYGYYYNYRLLKYSNFITCFIYITLLTLLLNFKLFSVTTIPEKRFKTTLVSQESPRNDWQFTCIYAFQFQESLLNQFKIEWWNIQHISVVDWKLDHLSLKIKF